MKDLLELGGSSLLNMNESSLSKLLSVVYPEYNWLTWKFSVSPHNFWSDVKNQRKFMDWAGRELKIKEMSDWYNVSNKVIRVVCVVLKYKGIA